MKNTKELHALVTAVYCINKTNGNEDKNIVLLVSENGCGGCHYVTARDLTREKNGNYFWYYGYYTDNFNKAVDDFNKRK